MKERERERERVIEKTWEREWHEYRGLSFSVNRVHTLANILPSFSPCSGSPLRSSYGDPYDSVASWL